MFTAGQKEWVRWRPKEQRLKDWHGHSISSENRRETWVHCVIGVTMKSLELNLSSLVDWDCTAQQSCSALHPCFTIFLRSEDR